MTCHVTQTCGQAVWMDVSEAMCFPTYGVRRRVCVCSGLGSRCRFVLSQISLYAFLLCLPAACCYLEYAGLSLSLVF